MDAGVDCGRKWFDGPCWVNRVDPNVQCIQFLQRKHFIPRRTQLEKALSSVLINLKTEDIAWSTTSSGSTELPNQIYLNKTFPTLQNFIRSTLYWVHRGREQTTLKASKHKQVIHFLSSGKNMKAQQKQLYLFKDTYKWSD